MKHSGIYHGNKSVIDVFSKILLYLTVLFIPINWLPAIDPQIIRYATYIALLLFIILQILDILVSANIKIPYPSVTITSILITLAVIAYGDIPRALIMGFGISTIFYFYRNQTDIQRIFHLFTIWIIILSVYSLFITFGPFSGFEISAPLNPTYNNPVDRWPGAYMHQNSFGFYAGRGVYTLTSVGFIFSTIYAYSHKSIGYFIGSSILIAQLINIYWLTGSGRAGFLLPLFLVLVAIFKRNGYEKTIPIIVISPIIIWPLVYLFKDFNAINQYIDYMNGVTSGRVRLYFDAVNILTSNPQALIGWGPKPWSEYTMVEMGVGSSFFSSENHFTRPHNFAFEFFVSYGLIIGSLLMYVCWNIAKGIVQQIQQSVSSTQQGIVVFLSGAILIGMAVGGKIGPFPINLPPMLLWWIGFGSFVSHITHNN
jgi:hypothetical protein